MSLNKLGEYPIYPGISSWYSVDTKEFIQRDEMKGKVATMLNPFEIAEVLLTLLLLRIILPAAIIFGIGGLIKRNYKPAL